MLNDKTLHLLGYAYGIAGSDQGSSDGPPLMQQSPFLSGLNKSGLKVIWDAMLKQDQKNSSSKLDIVTSACRELASYTLNLTHNKEFFTVLGGDHSCAIGTWSGAAHAFRNKGPLGMIWIDAHMDSHTFETTPTGNIHGMPLACLLGHGDTRLTKILDDFPKFKPEHVCLIGIRSYEAGEAELLKKLNVRIFFMDEVKQRGLDAVMQDALRIATTGTAGFGISIDIDSMDPNDAPGTGVIEPDGISAAELSQVLCQFADNPLLIGAEIAEFNPHHDKSQLTEKLIVNLISSLTLGK